MAHTTFTARYVQPLPHTCYPWQQKVPCSISLWLTPIFLHKRFKFVFVADAFYLLFSQELSTRIIHALSGAQRAAYVGFATFSSYVSLYRIGMSSMAMCDVVSGVSMFNFFVTCCR